MIALYGRMPPPLQQAKMMREQLGFALKPRGPLREAEKVLNGVIKQFRSLERDQRLLGRIYKDRWDSAKKEGRPEARSLLRRATDTYLDGFQADWRDAYPGVNAVTLMEMADKPDARQAQVLPVVRYAATRKAEKTPTTGFRDTDGARGAGKDPDDADLQLLRSARHGARRPGRWNRPRAIFGSSARCARRAARTPPGSRRWKTSSPRPRSGWHRRSRRLEFFARGTP